MELADSLPLVEELLPAPDPETVFRRLSSLPHCLFLDSTVRHEHLGRYSFVAADPFDFLEVAADGSNSLDALAAKLQCFTAGRVAAMPPFQGGAAGLFSYDLGRSLETLPTPAFDEFRTPALAVGLYDVVVAFDHGADRAWIISQGFPEIEPQARRERAAARLREARGWLAGDAVSERCPAVISPKANLAVEQLAPQFRSERAAHVTSNFSQAGYLDAVQRTIDYIHAGDVFQVNLAQRLLCPAWQEAVTLYCRLRQRNPAPFAAYFDAGALQIVSASPERFLCVRDRQVETRPIKGTRPRSGDALVDDQAQAALLASAKDRAENVMIVDLLRNDLSRVCAPDSVCVHQLCAIETYQYVFHLVSAIHGELRADCGPIELLRAAFPGGSITGAPKVRAMEIIAELEPTARGPYCGSVGYIGFDGTMDLSILIRTITAGRGWWQLPVGGGIVAQSAPHEEYEETWHKAAGLLQTLRAP